MTIRYLSAKARASYDRAGHNILLPGRWWGTAMCCNPGPFRELQRCFGGVFA